MYMSIIRIDQNKCLMRRDIKNNEEFIHKILLGALDYRSRTDTQLLYQKNKNIICVYSNSPFNSDALEMRHFYVEKTMVIDDLYNKISDGDFITLHFRTIPFRKQMRPNQKNSVRYHLGRKEDRINWVVNKLNQKGVTVCFNESDLPLVVEHARTPIYVKHSPHQKNTGEFEVNAYDYVVSVKVDSADTLRTLLQEGFGAYKSYGCGLILVGA